MRLRLLEPWMTSDDLIDARHTLDYTVTRMARELGVGRRTLQRMENGANISLRTALAVSNLLAEREKVK